MFSLVASSNPLHAKSFSLDWIGLDCSYTLAAARLLATTAGFDPKSSTI
jgi:hypothetical protein